MLWDFGSIQYFIKVAETLNFTRAARELYLSAQAVNKKILQLERDLGFPLFTRTTRSMQLTEAGRRCYDALVPVMRQYHAAMQAIGQLEQARQRILHVAFFEALPKNAVISPLVHCLKFHEPSLDIRLESAGLDDPYLLLERDGCDLCITNRHEFEQWNRTEISTVVLASGPAQIAVSLHHPWNAKTAVTVEDMAAAPLLLMRRTDPHYAESIYDHLPCSRREYASNFTSLLANLGCSQGYAVFPRMFESVRSSRLRFFSLPPAFEFQFEMVCAYKRGSPFVPLFQDMKAYFEDAPLQWEE